MKSILFLIIFFLTFCSFSGAEVLQKKNPQESSEKIDISKYLSKSDTLFVIHFHPTVQCSCCIDVGSFSKKGLEKFYTKPYKEGRIVFQECNFEEDSVTAKKYKIFWSSLCFQKSSKGKDEFKEIEWVWQFCEDEKKFLVNFKKELDAFLLGEKKSKSQTKTQNEKTSR
jgi:hypothetical protein